MLLQGAGTLTIMVAAAAVMMLMNTYLQTAMI